MLCLITQSCPILCNPTDCSLPGSSVHGILQARILEWVAFPFSRGSSQYNPGIKPRSPTLRVDSLPCEPPRKPRNTGMGSLFLLQGNFPTQESNRGLLHCRQIIYQLSYQGSPFTRFFKIYSFLIRGQLLYNTVLVSPIHPHESAIGTHMSLPS